MKFPNILLIGFGSIGKAISTVLRKEYMESRIHVIEPIEACCNLARDLGFSTTNLAITPLNLDSEIAQRLSVGDLLINVSTGVSSLALIECCQRRGIFYIDTCIEPWSGEYGLFGHNSSITNCDLRQQALSLHSCNSPTSIVAHGANPGIISHLMKKGLDQLADLFKIKKRTHYAQISHQLGIKVIQIAEHDTQTSSINLEQPFDFVNTWSVDGLLAEAWQFSELGLGTHDGYLCGLANCKNPGDTTSVVLPIRGLFLKVKSWTPRHGEHDAYLLTHHENISIAAFLSSKELNYRPTVYYAYKPASFTEASLERWGINPLKEPILKKVIVNELSSGFDELGCLFLFKNMAYWFGSTVNLDLAKQYSKLANATSLQVVAGIYAAMKYIEVHPRMSVIEAEQMDHEFCLNVAKPFLGNVSGFLTQWSPGSKLELNDFLVNKGQYETI